VKVHELTQEEFAAWVAVAKKLAWPTFEKDAAKGAKLISEAIAVK
jgi:hypothetical protein